MKTNAHVFATFPKSSKLTLEDREIWEDLVADYPPLSSLSFVDLMTWWNVLSNKQVS